ncbi:uncharacterized protein LOC144908194 [Branchiostoma floridae x Branchiostoma belcheri]
MAETSRAPLLSANGGRTAANWHDHMVTALKPDMPEAPAVRLVWCGDISGEVGVMGSWDGWSKVWKLNRSGNGEYSVALKIPCGQHEYKFRVNNTWFHDETKPTVFNSFGTLNNLVNVVKASNGNGPTKSGTNGIPEKAVPNGKNGPAIQASDPILLNKTAKEIYEHKKTTANTNVATPKIQEVLKPEPSSEFSQHAKPTSNGQSNQANGRADFSGVEPQSKPVDVNERMHEKSRPQKTTSYRVPPAVPPKPAKETIATAHNPEPRPLIKIVSGVESVQQTCPMSKSTVSRVPPTVPPKAAKEATVTAPGAGNQEPRPMAKVADKDVSGVERLQQSKTATSRVPPHTAPHKATTTAPQSVRARPEVPQKRIADKTGRSTAGGTVRKPETAPPKTRATFEKPPMTKPKPTQKRVVTAQAASKTAAKTVDDKVSSQNGQTETRYCVSFSIPSVALHC